MVQVITKVPVRDHTPLEEGLRHFQGFRSTLRLSGSETILHYKKDERPVSAGVNVRGTFKEVNRDSGWAGQIPRI